MDVVSIKDFKKKQKEILALDEDRIRKRLELEEREQDLAQRHHLLERLIQEEKSKMVSMLKHYGASNEDAYDFFKTCDNIASDSRHLYQQQIQVIEEERELANRRYHKSLENLESDLMEMRRKLPDADK